MMSTTLWLVKNSNTPSEAITTNLSAGVSCRKAVFRLHVYENMYQTYRPYHKLRSGAHANRFSNRVTKAAGEGGSRSLKGFIPYSRRIPDFVYLLPMLV
jgi:hypothetical protein